MLASPFRNDYDLYLLDYIVTIPICKEINPLILSTLKRRTLIYILFSKKLDSQFLQAFVSDTLLD